MEKMMEGTWGRRIFGTVEKGELTTRFRLTLETRDKKRVGITIYADNKTLAKYPEHYGQVLDMMVEEIDKALPKK